jgi:hypothetical protein
MNWSLKPQRFELPLGISHLELTAFNSPENPHGIVYHASQSPGDPRETNEDETQLARLERLGRARPDKFRSLWKEVGFCFSIVMSQVLTVCALSQSRTQLLIEGQEYFVSGFNVIIPTVARDLDIPRASKTWPANAFSLVVACFLLTFGRLADMVGGFPVYTIGLAWLSVWSLIAGFSQNELMLDFCRAIQGLGPAAYLPSSLMLLGSIYRPGPRKNIVFSMYGAAAPLGFYIGIFFAGRWLNCSLCLDASANCSHKVSQHNTRLGDRTFG